MRLQILRPLVTLGVMSKLIIIVVALRCSPRGSFQEQCTSFELHIFSREAVRAVVTSKWSHPSP